MFRGWKSQLAKPPTPRGPVGLTGLSHADEDKARSCAVKAVELWDSTPAAARSTLDDKSILFLSGNAGQSMREFASGAIARDGLPSEIHMEIAKLRFIPVVERVIERQHSLISKAGGKGRMGPLKTSLSLRATALFERTIAQNPDTLRIFIGHFDIARDVRYYQGKANTPSSHMLPSFRPPHSPRPSPPLTPDLQLFCNVGTHRRGAHGWRWSWLCRHARLNKKNRRLRRAFCFFH